MHSVKYDPMARVYYVLIEEKSKKHHVIEDYDVMINLISNIEYNCDVNNADQYKVFLEASLEQIKLESLDKDFDLMTLWKFRKPKLKEKIKKDNNET